MDCYCDYDAPVFYWQRPVKARKPHRCEECCRTIRPGERYELTTGKWPDDDHLGTYKTCHHCVDMRQFVKNSVPCFCWSHGSLRDDIRETVREAYWRAGSEICGFGFRLGRMEIARRRFAA